MMWSKTVTFLAAAIVLVPFAPAPALSQSCQVAQCLGNGMCMPDGTCQGTPISGGTCDDFNPCTTNDTCAAGQCMGTPVAVDTQCGDPQCPGTCQVVPFLGAFCLPDEETEGRACTDSLGACTTNDRCQGFFCIGDFISCPNTDNNLCTAEFCNPGTGQCESVGSPCGECEHCVGTSGQCEPGAVEGTPTSTPVASPTPTATPTGGSPTTTPTKTPPPPGECVADCDDDGMVSVASVIRAVHIALGLRLIEDCEDADDNGDGQVTADELVAAVRASIGGCVD